MTETQPAAAAPAIREIIESRRSIRRFVQEPMPEADLREILRLASLAPSANNVQPTRFVVIQNKDLQEQLQAVSYNQSQVTNAPAVIVVYADMEDVLSNVEETLPASMDSEQIKMRVDRLRGQFQDQDVAQRGQWALSQANIAFGFLMLAARGLGYDTVPMLGFDPSEVKKLLNLPEHTQFAGIMPIGKRAEEGFPHHRHSVDRITTWL